MKGRGGEQTQGSERKLLFYIESRAGGQRHQVSPPRRRGRSHTRAHTHTNIELSGFRRGLLYLITVAERFEGRVLTKMRTHSGGTQGVRRTEHHRQPVLRRRHFQLPKLLLTLTTPFTVKLLSLSL